MKFLTKSNFVQKKQFLLLIPFFLYLSNVTILSLLGTKLRPMEVLTPFLIIFFAYLCGGVKLKPVVIILALLPLGGLFNAVDKGGMITSYMLFLLEIAFLYILCGNTRLIPENIRIRTIDFAFKLFIISIVYAVIQFVLANVFDCMILYNNLGIFQYHPHYDNELRGIVRATSIFYEPSVLGWMCVFMFALNEYLQFPRYLRIVRISAVVGTLVSFSSSGIIGLGLMIAFAIFYKYRNHKSFKMILLVGLGLLVIAGPFLFSFLRLGSIFVEGTSGYNRIAYPFLAMVETLREYPLFGRGLGQIAIADANISHSGHIYNAVFGIIVTFGLSGLLIYQQLGKLFYKWFRADKKTLPFVFLVLFLLFTNGSFLTLEYPIIIFLLHLAVEIKSKRKQKNKTRCEVPTKKTLPLETLGEDLPLISVIVPVYNVEQYLRRCVDSILAQSYPNLEIILVNDGATDSCPQICDEYVRTESRIRVVHKPNGGLSSARNAGLDIATGEYYAFVDSDDWIEKDMYLALLLCCRNNNVPLAACGRYDVDARTMQKSIGLCPRTCAVISGASLLCKALTWTEVDFSCCDKLFHKSLWRNRRFPLAKKSEDTATLYPLFAQLETVALLNEPFYNYFHREGSITTSTLSAKTFDILDISSAILEFVREEQPDCLTYSQYFRVKSVASVLVDMMRVSADVLSDYKDKYNAVYAELKSGKPFWKNCPLFSKADRILFTLLLYPSVYQLIRKAKQLLKRFV